MVSVHREAGRSALPVCLDRENRNRLVSLWDIVKRFQLEELLRGLHLLDVQYMAVEIRGRRPEAQWMDAEWRNNLMDQMEGLQEFCSLAGFQNSGRKIRGSLILFKGRKALNVLAASNELRGIREAISADVGDRVFICVDTNRAEFVDAPKLFGERVYRNFPSARNDVKESGNCPAAELHTAAVFHLMRAVEIGLRTLARDRRVKLAKKRLPYELATWDEIIRELEKAELEIQGYPKTLAREAQFEFVHGAMMQFKSGES